MKKLAFLYTAVTLTIALAWSQSGGPSGTQSKAEFAGSFVKWILASSKD